MTKKPVRKWRAANPAMASCWVVNRSATPAPRWWLCGRKLAYRLVRAARYTGPRLPGLYRTQRAGLHSRADTRSCSRAHVFGAFQGRPYIIDAPTYQEALREEINHVFWSATGREYPQWLPEGPAKCY